MRKTISLKTCIGMMMTLFMLCSMPLPSSAQSASKTITCKCKNEKLSDALRQIERLSGYYRLQFSYSDVSGITANADVTGLTAPDAVKLLLEGTPLECEVQGQFIYINKVKQNGRKGAKTITGKVTDSNNEPLTGVTVTVKGGNSSASTDVNGRYKLTVPDENSVLLFRFLGMNPHQVNVKGKSSIDVVMKDATIELQEAVIVSTGYQKISKERSTASYGFVDSKKLTQQMHKDIKSALEGQVAGLRMEINPNTGENSPILRGVGTFSNNVGTQPLIVVDEMATNLTLDEINPYNVESVTVLKDAAAASIYGALAANGVIVVTTKQAKEAGVKVDVNADWYISTKPSFKSMHYANTNDYIDFQTEMYKARVANAGGEATFFSGLGTNYYSPLYQLYRDQKEEKLSDSEVASTLAQWRGNNFYEQFRENAWRTAVTQRYNVALNSRSTKSDNYVSFNYEHDNNRMVSDKGHAFSIYYKANFKIKKWLTFRAGVDTRITKSQAADLSMDQNSQEPFTTIYDASGNKVYQPYVNMGGYVGSATNGTNIANYIDNPLFMPFTFNAIDALHENIGSTRGLRIRPFMNAEVRFLKMFRYNLMYQYEWADNKRELMSTKDSYAMRMAHNSLIDANGVSQLPDGARYYQYAASSKRYTFRNQLNFDKVFNGGHAVNAITGLEFRQNRIPMSVEQLIYGFNPQSLTGQRSDWETWNTTGFDSMLHGTTVKVGGPTPTKTDIFHRYASFYANASYSYKYKYNLTGSVRWDEADLFGLDTKEQKHPLWSIGAGWNITGEKFMENVSWVDYLKLRATYGINGNVDQSSTTYFVAKYKTISTSLQPIGFTYLDYDNDDLPNPKLRWEKTTTTNIGLDFRILNNRISGSVEYYNRYGSDLLVRRFMDSTLGATSRVVNNGEIRNRGIEFTLTGTIVNTKDWNLSATLIHAINNNKVMAVDEDPTWIASNYITSPTNYFKKGTSYNTLWAYRLSRVVNGYPVILDADGKEMAEFDANGNVTSVRHASTLKGTDALVNMGSVTPKYNGSLSLNLRYKDFELNTLFVYAGGNKLRLDVADLSEGGYTMRSTHILDRWTASNSDGVRLYLDMDNTARQYASDFNEWWRYNDQQIKDADYFKLRSINLAYNLGKTICDKIRINSAKITFQVNNLFYWSKAGNDIDPEAYGLNTGTRSVIQPRTFSIGFSTSF